MRHLRLLLLLLPLGCLAQVENGIQQWHAYYTITHKGNIQVDEQGNPLDDGIDTVFTLIAEVKSTDTALLQFAKAYAGGRWLKPTKQIATAAKMVVGYDREHEKEIGLLPKPGNMLMQVHLDPGAYAALPTGAPAKGLLITGRYKGKNVSWTMLSLTALPPIYYP